MASDTKLPDELLLYVTNFMTTNNSALFTETCHYFHNLITTKEWLEYDKSNGYSLMQVLSETCETGNIKLLSNFNMAPSSDDSPYRGIGVLWWACYLANHEQPALLLKIMTLLPDDQFNQLDFNMAPSADNAHDRGKSVLWIACHLASINQPALLQKIMELPDDQFNQLDFNMAPSADNSPARGKNVLWWACCLASSGQQALLLKIVALPDEKFNQLDFDSLNDYISSIISNLIKNDSPVVVNGALKLLTRLPLKILNGKLDGLFIPCLEAFSGNDGPLEGGETQSKNFFHQKEEKMLELIEQLTSDEMKTYACFLLATRDCSNHYSWMKMALRPTEKPPIWHEKEYITLMHFYLANLPDSNDESEKLLKRLQDLTEALQYSILACRNGKDCKRMAIMIARIYIFTNKKNIGQSIPEGKLNLDWLETAITNKKETILRIITRLAQVKYNLPREPQKITEENSHKRQRTTKNTKRHEL